MICSTLTTGNYPKASVALPAGRGVWSWREPSTTTCSRCMGPSTELLLQRNMGRHSMGTRPTCSRNRQRTVSAYQGSLACAMLLDKCCNAAWDASHLQLHPPAHGWAMVVLSRQHTPAQHERRQLQLNPCVACVALMSTL